MSAPSFLVGSLPTGETCTLDGPEGHHASTVQRLRVGEPLLLTDGRGGTAAAVVAAVGRGTLDLTITTRGYADPPDPRLVVVQGIAKGDRGELAVQAMTEVGVDEIVPWAAERSVVRWRDERGERARQRWVATAREAAKQARRPWHPTVSAAASTADVAHRLTDVTTRAGAAGASAAGSAGSAGAAGSVGVVTGLVLHEEAELALSRVPLPVAGEIVLVIGPEGGIAPAEVAAFETAGAVPVRLGAEVLRTSTAGVAALAVLSARLGRW